MFKSVRIQNFRQFKDLKLDGLARINLIAGQNNTGKTSILEALFIHGGAYAPYTVLAIANLRDIEEVVSEGPSAWGWLFRGGAESEPLVIESSSESTGRFRMRISVSNELDMDVSDASRRNLRGRTPASISTAVSPPTPALIVEYEDDQARRGSATVRLTGRTPSVDHEGDELRNLPTFFLAHKPESAARDAQAYSRIVQDGREDEVLDALRAIDSRVQRLRVLDTGTGPRVYADFGDKRLLPMNVAGQGFARVLSLVVAIIETSGGVVLIDEIEDGLHYGVMPGVWRAITKAALVNDVQLFATTHSLEAIYSAVEGSQEREGSLAFFRLQRRGEDVEVVRGEDFRLRAAARVGTELR
jgi:hypothetical protein